MKVNVDKTKVMVFERGESTTECDILIEGEKVEQVTEFVYLGSLFANDAKHDRDIERRMNTGNKLNEALFAIMNNKSVSRQGRLAIHNVVLCMLVKAGMCCWYVECLGKIEVDVTERCGLREDVVTRVERSILWWFGHLKKINESRLIKQIHKANVRDGKVSKGRCRKSYADHIVDILKKGLILSIRNRRVLHEKIDGCQ
ncbi:hypothetical protein EVAR_6332_1 [Eumeta japonica]|uniref:Reverse transcriptase domain-containing protein n=1 Tax=Eumeta variegata TaxID=151549 RepID=A0A4C1T9E1_EUMVA|nr:hypothetical protein EVAR_6332_1 [Eumeta japonica]